MTQVAKAEQETNVIYPSGDNSELEFDATSFDPEKVSEVIRRRGCALVRGLIDKQGLEHIRLRALRTYAEKDEEKFLGKMTEEYNMGIYRFGHVRFGDMSLPGEQPMHFLQHLFSAGHLDILGAYYKEDFSFLMRNTILRKQGAGLDSQRVPFHQDGAFLEPGMPILNSWIPLVPCGEDAPGLEMVTVGLDKFVELDKDDARTYGDVYLNININDKTVAEKFDKSCLWRPIMNVGDVIFFTGYTIHRTNYSPDMKRERISIEARTAPQSKITATAAAAGLATVNVSSK